MGWYDSFNNWVGEKIIYPAIRVVIGDDKAIIENQYVNHYADAGAKLNAAYDDAGKKLQDGHVVQAAVDVAHATASTIHEYEIKPIGKGIGEGSFQAYAAVTGDKTGENLFGTQTGNPEAKNGVISNILNPMADVSQNVDSDRFITVAGRSLVEKGVGGLLAIPGDIIDLSNRLTGWATGYKFYNGSLGSWTREKSYSGVQWAESKLGIKPLEIRNKDEAFLSGMSGEIVGNAFFFTSAPARLLSISGKALAPVTSAFGSLKTWLGASRIAETVAMTSQKVASASESFAAVAQPISAITKPVVPIVQTVAGKTMKVAGPGLDGLSMVTAGLDDKRSFNEQQAAKEEASALIQSAAPALAQEEIKKPSLQTQFNEKASEESGWSSVFNIVSNIWASIKDIAIEVASALGLTETFNKFAAADPNAPSSAMALTSPLNLVPSSAQAVPKMPVLGLG